MPRLKRKEAGSLSQSERQKLQKLYTQSGAAYGSVRNLVKARNLSVSMVIWITVTDPDFNLSEFDWASFRCKRYNHSKNDVVMT